MNTQKTSEKDKEKIHDKWYLISYLSLAIFIYTYMIITFKDSGLDMVPNPRIVILTFIHILFSYLITALSLTIFPEVLIHLCCIITSLIFLYIGVIFYSLEKIVGVVAFIFFVVLLGYYILFLRNKIKFTSMIIKESAEAFIEKLHILGPIIIIVSVFAIIQTIYFCMALYSNPKYIIWLFIPGFLYISWSFFVASYFLKVFMSLVIFYEMIDIKNVSSLKYFTKACRSLGSVCFASLHITYVIINNLAQNRTSYRRVNGYPIFRRYTRFKKFRETKMEAKEREMKKANLWSLPYMAINEKGYNESSKEGNKILSKNDNLYLMKSICLRPALYIYSILLTFIFYFVLKYSDLFDMEKISTFISFSCVFVAMIIFSETIYASAIVFLFAHELHPQIISEKYPKAFESIQDRRKKIKSSE